MASLEPLSVTTTYEVDFKCFLLFRSEYKRKPWPEAKLEKTPGNQNRRPSPGLPGLACSSLWAEFTDISRAEALPVEGETEPEPDNLAQFLIIILSQGGGHCCCLQLGYPGISHC